MDKISFIIVGKNQEKTIYECIKSVYSTIRENNLPSYEVIFVDSDSKDKTLDIINENFPGVIIVRLKGKLNVSIAKNNGAAAATGDVYFFIDGDITLDDKFTGLLLDEDKNFKYKLACGELEEILYNSQWNQIGYVKARYTKDSPELGGIFALRADAFKAVSGFKEYMKLDEDSDLQMRLASQGVLVQRLPEKMGTHHTIYYFFYRRLFRRFIIGDFFYLGVFYRKHLLERACIHKFVYMQKFTVILVALIFASIFLNPFFLFAYPALVLLKYLTAKSKKCSFFEYLLGRFFTDTCCILGFIAFYPGLKKADYMIVPD